MVDKRGGIFCGQVFDALPGARWPTSLYRLADFRLWELSPWVY